MITIIGAGPAGLRTATLLAGSGHDVTVFDRKKKIGHPIQCTGIVTSKIKEIMEIRQSTIENKITNIEVNSKNCSAKIRLKDPDLVLDRARFDQDLSEKAEKEGAKIELQKEFIRKTGDKIRLRDIKEDRTQGISSNILIGADGPLSPIYNILNPDKKRTFYKGLQVKAKGLFDKDTFKVYLGSVCPGFFAWLVPENDVTARVGLASRENPKPLLKKFLSKINIKKATEIQAGLIPCYEPKIITQKDNTFLIGDAAGQVKASTGGGIYQGLVAAQALSDSINKNLDYENLWKSRLSKDLGTHLKIRKTLDKFTDQDYDRLVKMMGDSKVQEVLSKESRDSSFNLVLKLLLAKPSFLRFIPKIF